MPQPVPEAIAQSWIVPFWPTLGMLITGILYLRGWRLARITRPRELPPWRALCFFAGLICLWLALASPLDALDQFLLVAHMTQHLLLMSVAPPLLLLGNPIVPMLRGLPRSFVRDELAPWMNSRVFHWLQRLFTNPVIAWIAMDLAVVLWHLPAAYELGLRSNFWHQMEHACFFFTSLAFWWYVVRPWPNRIRSSRWLIIPYVASAHAVLFFVGLVIALDGRVIYPMYAQVPRLFGISALTDQTVAGGEMILVGLLVTVAALVPIMLQLLSDRPQTTQAAARESAPRPSAGVGAVAPAFDLLRVPVAGSALRSRYGRGALQFFSIVVLSAIILDGLCGVQVPPLNSSGALLWNVLRPINLILLLFVANIFCMACPFTLPRELVRRLGIPQLRWPEWLSSKWPAAVLMLVFFWAYEQFALWSSPRDTALLLISYVAVATIINSVFLGASFCKYICPVGQFNFIASLFAPFELGVRSQHVCSNCSTHDCVRGNATQRGCELKLYLPNKVGNLDCTLCMDCVKACPEDNVSITLQSPLRDLARDPVRSSLGRTSARPDLAVLILVVVFSSIANAAVMIAPVARFLSNFRQQHSWAAGPLLSLLATVLFAAILLLLYVGVARLMQLLATRQTLRTVFCRFSIALLPLGLSIWVGHLAFHLASSWSSIPALLQHLSAQFSAGHPAAAQHTLSMPHKLMAASSSAMFTPLLGANGLDLFDLQIWIVNLGLFVSWYAGRKVIRQMANSNRRIWSMSAMWAVSSTAMYAVAVWIFTQPMYMRGMGM
ncbi:MAG: cytochrome c oxidase assembly protein [Acidobacteriaceae bacterium]